MTVARKNLPEFQEKHIEEFWKRVNKKSTDDCWEWLGTKKKNGYGALSVKCKELSSHRVAYFLHYGIDTVGFVVCHSCDNPICCNPQHLFLGSDADNRHDAVKKGRIKGNKVRHFRGEDHPLRKHPERAARGARQGLAKLDDEKVREIRRRHQGGEATRKLARDFGIRQSTMINVVRCVTWKHVKD